jgi:outer membrane lipoprotein SlyB
MPQKVFEVTAPDGRTLEITGDRMPTPVELQAIFAQYTQKPAPDAATGSTPDPVKSRSGPDLMQEIQRRERERTSAGAKLMPTIGAAAGGVIGGIPGAAIGGAFGKALEQSVLRGQGDERVPSSPLGQLKDIGIEGGIQGVLQGAGTVAFKGAGATAKWLMNRATTRVSAKLAQQFPELSDTLIENAIAVSKGGEAKARTLLQMAKAKANAALGAAEAAGKSVPIQLTPEVADSFKTALIEKAVKTGSAPVPTGSALTVATDRLPTNVKAFLAQIDEAVKAGETVNITPSQADLLKTQLQKESRALYANRVAPNGPNAQSQEATIKAELASRVNDAIDAIATGYKTANADAKQMLGAMRGVAQARRPSGNLYQAMVRPAVGGMLGAGAGQQQGGTAGAVAGGVLGAAAMSPAGMSKTAITLGNPVFQSILKQLPRASQALLIELFEGRTQTPATAGTPR